MRSSALPRVRNSGRGADACGKEERQASRRGKERSAQGWPLRRGKQHQCECAGTSRDPPPGSLIVIRSIGGEALHERVRLGEADGDSLAGQRIDIAGGISDEQNPTADTTAR